MLLWHECVEHLRGILPSGTDAYIVGGAVRDACLGRPLHDIDIATPGDGRALARLIADRLHGAYYPLDAERGVGRALISCQDLALTVDVARYRGPDLETDLRARDFSINAMAVQLDGDLQTVIDPTGGMQDLQDGRLRQCQTDAIASDPVRALRAVRLSVTLRLTIEPQTRRSLREAAVALLASSAERLRDEFMQILSGHRPALALRVMDELGLLAPIIPEVEAMRGLVQASPHQFDVLQHTLQTVERLGTILDLLKPNRADHLAASVQTGAIATAVQRYLPELRAHFAQTWPNGRSHNGIVLLAALLHDIGKPATRSWDERGHIRFIGHEQVGERLAAQRASALRLSNPEVSRVASIVRHHMRPHALSAEDAVTRRALYRFWRDTGPAGVDVVFLAACDYLATYGTTLDSFAWVQYVGVLQTIMGYSFDRSSRVPDVPLISGRQLMEHFALSPGPQIGALLEGLQEAQAAGEINTQADALEWVKHYLQRET